MNNDQLLAISKQLEVIIKMSNLLGDTSDISKYKIALQDINKQIHQIGQ